MDKLAQLGTTDLKLSRHGFGAARIGDGAPLSQIEKLLGSLQHTVNELVQSMKTVSSQ